MLVWATCHTGSIREVRVSVDPVESAAVPPHGVVLAVRHAIGSGHGGDAVGG